MFTTMTPPGAELSDAASMAYSSILQSQQQIGQANKGAVASGGATGHACLPFVDVKTRGGLLYTDKAY